MEFLYFFQNSKKSFDFNQSVIVENGGGTNAL